MYIDISRKINNNLAIYPGDPEVSIKQVASVAENGYSVHSISLGSHCGTHIDFPRHFYKNGKTAEDYAPEKFCGAALVIEVNKGDKLDEDFFAQKLIEKDDIILLKFNCKPFGITFDAAQYLASCSIKLIGTEAMDIEDYEDFRVHKYLLSHDILILECADLQNVSEGICTLFAFPLNIENSDGAPVRAVIKTTALNQKHDAPQNM
ncbi:MAG: cyclase family protein [Firmicutes bacterium]|nr:cyclase family protein [Bacillota bacterium]